MIIVDFLYHLITYGAWWIAFVALVFMAARYAPWPCIPAAFLAVVVIMYVVDVHWIVGKMHKAELNRDPGADISNWDGGPDLDGIFMMGFAIRVVLMVLILTPFTIIGRHRKMMMMKA